VAFREVETALAADHHLRLQEQALAQASTEATRSADLARTSYERGLSDILTMLDAQRRAFDAKSALITTQATRIRNRVDLHLALGGGY
jgi:outer membrane protein TolC